MAAEERAARIEARNVAAREKAKEERVRHLEFSSLALRVFAAMKVESNPCRQAARLQAQREQREAEIAAQDALLAMDVSTVEDGATLSSIVGQRAKARERIFQDAAVDFSRQFAEHGIDLRYDRESEPRLSIYVVGGPTPKTPKTSAFQTIELDATLKP